MQKKPWTSECTFASAIVTNNLGPDPTDVKSMLSEHSRPSDCTVSDLKLHCEKAWGNEANLSKN